MQPTGGGRAEQLVIGQAAPYEEGEARRELEIADTIDAADGDVLGLTLEAVDEMRIDEQSGQRILNADVEGAALLVPEPIELHEHLELVVAGGDRLAVGTRREPRQDLLGALRLFGRRLRFAREDRATARRVAGAAGIVGTIDREAADRAAELDFAEIELVDAGAAPVVDERRRDSLRARGHAQAEMAASIDLDRRTVERDVNTRSIAIDETPRRIVPAGLWQRGLDRELVHPVERKAVLDDEAAARAERQAFEVMLLGATALPPRSVPRV